jgi:hypothetical protein
MGLLTLVKLSVDSRFKESPNLNGSAPLCTYDTTDRLAEVSHDEPRLVSTGALFSPARPSRTLRRTRLPNG